LELLGDFAIGVDIGAGEMNADVVVGERNVIILGDHIDRRRDKTQSMSFFGHRKTGQNKSGRFPILVKSFVG
jgi:hypothetical protein